MPVDPWAPPSDAAAPTGNGAPTWQQPPAWEQPQPAWHPAWSSTTQRHPTVSLAAFFLALYALVPVAVPLAVAGLVGSRRTGAPRAMAVWALVVSAGWGLVLAMALNVHTGAAALPQSTVTTTERVDATSLQPGDCLTGLPDDMNQQVMVTPCAGPHAAQVFGTPELPRTTTPTEDGLYEAAEEACERLRPAGTGQWYYYVADPEGFLAGDREVFCVAEVSPLGG